MSKGTPAWVPNPGFQQICPPGEQTLPFSLGAACGPPRSGDRDALGSRMCLNVLSRGLLGCQAADVTAQSVPQSWRITHGAWVERKDVVQTGTAFPVCGGSEFGHCGPRGKKGHMLGKWPWLSCSLHALQAPCSRFNTWHGQSKS